MSVNKMLLGCSHAPSFAYCLGLLLSSDGWQGYTSTTEFFWWNKPKTFLSSPESMTFLLPQSNTLTEGNLRKRGVYLGLQSREMSEMVTG